MIVPEQISAVEAVADHYDELDRFYREIWGEHVHHGLWLSGRETPAQAVVQLSERVARLAKIRPGENVCDVGCGYGATARLLAQRFGAEVTGLTVSPRQHAYACAQASGGANPRYLLCDWLENSLPNQAFDAVIAIESTEHMRDKPRCFIEAARVLKPGGRFVVCAWLAHERAAAWQVRHLLKPICVEGRLPGMGTQNEYARMFEEAGFHLRHTEDVSRQVSRTWTICMKRMLRECLRRPHYRRYLLDRKNANRIFARTLLRIRLAYATGAMRYTILAAEKRREERAGRFKKPGARPQRAPGALDTPHARSRSLPIDASGESTSGCRIVQSPSL